MYQSVAHQVAKPFVQEGESTQQRPGHHNGCAPGQFKQAKSCLGDGVVCGFLVGHQGNLFRKRSGHVAAVPGHMADLATGQPELQDQAEGQGQREGDRRVKGGGIARKKFVHGL